MEMTLLKHAVSVPTTRWGIILIVCGRTPTNYLLYGEQVTLSATQLVDPRQQFGVQ